MFNAVKEFREKFSLSQDDVSKYLQVELDEYQKKELEPLLFQANELLMLTDLFHCKIDDLLSYSMDNQFESDKNKQVKIPKLEYNDESIKDLVDSEGFITLYKYLPFNNYLMDTILKKRVYMSYVKDFNDPFELIGNLSNHDGHNKGYVYYGSIVVAPFTLVNNSEVMWAHYAQNYSGVCIRFKFNLNTLIQKGYYIGRVMYFRETPKIVSYDDSTFTQEEAFTKFEYTKTIFQKKGIWEYEQEIRIVKQIYYPEIKDNPEALYFSNGRFGRYNNPPNYIEDCEITGVIIGHYVHSANRTKIISWAKQKSIPLYVTHIDKHNNKIVITD